MLCTYRMSDHIFSEQSSTGETVKMPPAERVDLCVHYYDMPHRFCASLFSFHYIPIVCFVGNLSNLKISTLFLKNNAYRLSARIIIIIIVNICYAPVSARKGS